MQKIRVRAILALAVMLALFTSSCIINSSEINVDISCDEFTKNSNIRNDFNIEVGDKIRINLCSNPSTGFQWNYKTIGQTILKEEDRDFEEPDGENVGTAGKDIWAFEAIEKGSTEIHLEYSRNWEGGEKAVWEYTFTVKVK